MKQEDEAAPAFWLLLGIVSIAVLNALFGCATALPRSADDVCYTPAENARLHAELKSANDEVDSITWQMMQDRAKERLKGPKIEGLKGYCS